MTHEYPYSIKRHGTTLEKCEYEPVQTPGCIQAHGVLLVLRPGDLTILQVSENSLDWLGFSPEELLAKNVATAVGKSAAEIIRSALDEERLDKVPLYLTTLKPGEQKNKRRLHASLHTHAGLVLLELEDAAPSDLEPPDRIRVDPDYYGLVRKTLTRFQEVSGIPALSQAIAEELRRITELDRVMVYYFHADYSGEVIAESKREDQASWLGWRYPAHDIPQPAREIFKKIWSRPVPDVRAELFEMVPLLNPDTNAPLDMTYCFLRGASVMYTEYLDNMGVRAALTLPLMREGELWGLIACHHDTPKIMSYRVRAAAEFLARGGSQQLRLAEERENTAYRIALESANYALISKVALAPEISAFTEGPVHLGASLDCGGAAIFCQESWYQVGQTPGIEEMAELGEWLLARPECREGSPNPIFVTDHLSELYPAAKTFAGSASGLMAFCFSRKPLGLVLYFKPETLQTLTWAGNPHELPIVDGPHGPRLSPRKSFELWREVVSNRSMPWKRVEIEATQKLRGLIIDMLVSKAKQLNILRRRVAERTRELEASRAQLQAVLDAATQVAIISTTPEGLITVFNRGAERMLGYTSEEIVGKQTPAIFHLESEIIARGRKLTEEMGRPVQGLDVFQMKAEKHQHDELECTYVRKDGSHLPVSLIITARYDTSGALVGFLGMARDMTAQKKAEEASRASEERFRLIVESVKDYALFMLDPGGHVVSWNAGAERIKGYTADEIVGRHFSCFYLPEAIERAHPDEVLRIAATEGRYLEEGWRLRKDGSRFLADVVISAIYANSGEVRGFAKVTRDVTEQRKAERKLAHQALMLDLANDTIFIRDEQDRITYWNQGAQRLYGWSRQEAQGQVSHNLFHTQFPQPVEEINARLRAEGHWEGELVHTCRDGSQVTVSSSWTLRADDGNRTSSVIETSHDITARKRAEDELKSSVLRLSLATDAIEAGIWELDVRANVMSWDERMCDIYGLPKNLPVDYQTWANTVAPEDLPATEATLQGLIASKSQDSAEFRIKHSDGSQRYIHAAAGVLLDDAGEVARVIGLNIDVTERKTLELRFLRSQRLESIGTLAGGIAHDLNNILAPIVMSIDLLKSTSENPETNSILETIEISAKRGAEIVGQVLSFVRGLEGGRIEVQLLPLLRELEKIIKNTFPKDVRLRSATPGETWAILGDPTQVRQMLLNLCVNARDAMPKGGLLTVRGENCVIDEYYAAMNPQARAGRYVRIDVTDTGTGIPPSILGKIFEPFFTTKELGQGTGLGLSTVMAIVKSHDGFINVYSEPGKGTTFKVYLPAMETASEARIRASGKVSVPRGNGETVLVVDDEASIRGITSRTLEAFGCRVLTATDGADAVAVYLEHKDKIDVVLTDMAMPVMDGSALIHALIRINPAVKIIAASGLDTNGTVTESTRGGIKRFLAKPYTAETLLQAVGALLEKS
jgi:PAS domain S-box-containing protein